MPSSPSSSSRRHLHAVPLAKRPPRSVTQIVQMLLFNAVFGMGMIAIHTLQLCIIPLHLHPATLPTYNRLCDWTKGLYAKLLIFITAVWAPTTLRITVDEGDEDLNLDKIVQRDGRGRVVGLDLPERMVLMANHQVYCDWSYIWNLLYFAGLHDSLTIILKASLKWVPVVGPAMQMFRFIFMQRSWAADKVNLAKSLAKFSKRANERIGPSVLLIFPEGTLVSPQTRPASEKYASKIPTLRLLDATVAYPGIPNGGYGQDYYTLQSIFSDGIPPPAIHIHLHSYAVKYDLPIGKSSLSDSLTTGSETSESERKEFDDWLLARWREKDERMQLFLDEGRLSKGKYVDIPLTFGSGWEAAELLFASILGLWLGKMFLQLLWHVVV